MVKVQSWAWYSGFVLPGFNPSNQDNLGAALNGYAINPLTIRQIVWDDVNNDGLISDGDTDDSSAPAEFVEIGGKVLAVQEIAAFENSVMVVQGQTLSVQLGVWMFSDGSFMVRLNDSQIPPGASHNDVRALTLGEFNPQEYSGSYVKTRDEPFVCFTAGALVHTRGGLRPVESLAPGDLVLTADHGFQPLRWIGKRRVRGTGVSAPVRIAAGALGNARDLWVSQMHRMLVTGWRAELFGGASEMLVAARHLVNGRTITLSPRRALTYIHLLFDQHEIVFVEGIGSESFHPGAVGLSRLEEQVRAEVLHLFPQLQHGPAAYGPTARPTATAAQGVAIGLA